MGGGCPHGHTLTIKCPYRHSSPLHTLSAIPKIEYMPAKGVQAAQYNVSSHVDCILEDHIYERIGQHDSSSIISDDDSDVKIACCLIVYGEKARAVLKQFIAYHRLIGYDHFFITLLEDYDNQTSMVHQINL